MGKSNKEKAEELYPTDFNYLGSGVINVPVKEREAFVKGAEWKENEILEKVFEFLNRIDLHFYVDNPYRDESYNDVLIEDLKKAMKGE